MSRNIGDNIDVYGFLSNVYGINMYDADKPLQRILQYFTGKIPSLSELGIFAGRDLLEITDYVDKISKPKHIMWDVNGNRVDRVWLNPAERYAIEKLVLDFGINKPPYHGGSWHEHYAMGYLISDPGLYCIITITNQTAYALHKYGNEELKRYVPKLIGDDKPINFGATWFTEIQGGSDLGANTTVAKVDGGKWRLYGDKYFASGVGLADIALTSARPEGGKPGAKGLALFAVPRLDSSGNLNFMVRRLKDKSGTNSVPTGEVEFHGSEAYLVGDQSNGIYYIMEDLMVSRLANAIGAVGVARKAYLEAYEYASRRRAFGKLLIEHPLVIRDLMDMEVALEGATALVFKAVDEFDRSWHDKPPYGDRYHYARLLTHIAKNVTADAAAYITRLAMELYGGIGFLSEYPIERWHREALITPIWEGTSNIQALDMLEAMNKKNAHITMLSEMENTVASIKSYHEIAEAAMNAMRNTMQVISSLSSLEIEFRAKDILSTVGHAISIIVLTDIAEKLGIERYAVIAELYLERHLQGGYKVGSYDLGRKIIDIENEVVTYVR
ncbi:acyl-CoA dehydrogenase domain protein [Vulcanisaeta moutnovskia 768-28]|uniref:Acyl-CoA dehydrogenase domain protein n=1 Tax=Vulcanisaeta moutnovskia (strain 768-28) TaxID=985053 RepID=F0QYW3_VULM7|nr:acyl-CoA dehydrogenase family protein [Vulcanisaeta moutnovskia]ADY00244.1 acyl-CoA dehydrogenase domain protein [Vulcanisaeta moutnovskia 768-28]